MSRRVRVAAAAVLVAAACGACGGGGAAPKKLPPSPATLPPLTKPASQPPTDVYAADRPGELSPAARGVPARIYVPNSESGSVTVIDERSMRVIDTFATGELPQHVTPSYDLRRLWVDNDLGNTLTPIDPHTGKPGTAVPVEDPYNLYFEPDGSRAIVVAERLERLDFRDPNTMRLVHSLTVSCYGVDHMDFTADGRYALASCEFGGNMIVIDLRAERVVRNFLLHPGAAPQDVKLSPDGRTFYVADQTAGGVWTIDAGSFRVLGLLPTGAGAHGLYTSRDSRFLYVSDRSEGAVAVVSFRTRKVITKWVIPGGSPDMGGVSADGKVLWLSGRYSAEVYAIDTSSGKLLARIPVGQGPHGLCVWPQPGRYSIGHTGILR